MIKNKILKRIVDSSTLKQAEQKVYSDKGTLYKNIENDITMSNHTSCGPLQDFAPFIYAPYQPLFVCKAIDKLYKELLEM